MRSPLPSPCPEGFAPVREGFTLLELLVATAVLAVVLTLMVQVIQYASNVAKNGREAAEVHSSARAILDTIGRDVDNIILDDRLTTFAGDATRDGTLAFYTKIPGIASANANDPIRRLSLVRYDYDPDAATLSRADLGITWQQTNLITFGNTNSLPRLTSVQPRRLCDGVLAFDYVYLHADGKMSRNLSATTSPVRAMRVTLALLDPEGSRVLAGAAKQEQFIQLFETKRPAITAGMISTKTAWQQALEDPAVWNGIQESARRRLKIYDRLIPLPPS